MNNFLKPFIDKNNVIFKWKYGFGKGYCTQFYAILYIINKIQANMDKELQSCGIFIDTVDQNILLCKLHHYGIRGLTLGFLHIYRVERKRNKLSVLSLMMKQLYVVFRKALCLVRFFS